MTKNSCETIQLNLLQGRSEDDHLASCADCRAFAETLATATRLPELEPPAALDQAILAHAEARQRTQAPPKLARAPLLFAVIAAAAAVILAFALQPDDTPPNNGTVARVTQPVTPPVAAPVLDDSELTQMLTAVADADYSGDHIDDELLAMELQLAAMTVDNF